MKTTPRKQPEKAPQNGSVEQLVEQVRNRSVEQLVEHERKTNDSNKCLKKANAPPAHTDDADYLGILLLRLLRTRRALDKAQNISVPMFGTIDEAILWDGIWSAFDGRVKRLAWEIGGDAEPLLKIFLFAVPAAVWIDTPDGPREFRTPRQVVRALLALAKGGGR